MDDVKYVRCSCRSCGSIGNFKMIALSDPELGLPAWRKYEVMNNSPSLFHICSDGNIGVCDIIKIYLHQPPSEIKHTIDCVYNDFKDAVKAAKELEKNNDRENKEGGSA